MDHEHGDSLCSQLQPAPQSPMELQQDIADVPPDFAARCIAHARQHVVSAIGHEPGEGPTVVDE